MKRKIQEAVSDLIDLALAEDIGEGDHSSLACIPADANGKVKLLIKEEGILAGIEIVEILFRKVDTRLKTEVLLEDGSKVKPGDIGFLLEGPRQSILKSERLALNIMQRMSGIATATRSYAELISDLKTKVLDTRKTTPGFRAFEKEAVRIGGGCNHRMGLYDMIMLKDNHIDFAGGIEPAIRKTNEYLKHIGRELEIIIESRSFDEIKEIISYGGVSRILLDNFSVDDTRKAVEMIKGRYETESSGGITHKTIRAYAECGVDYVSVGALTHKINSMDISLKAV